MLVVGKTTHTEILDSMTADLGQIMGLLSDPGITDIEYNSVSENIFFDGAEGRKIASFSIEASSIRRFIKTVASYFNTSVTEDSPTLSARLPEAIFNCRMEASISPVVEGVSLVLRKPGNVFPVQDYIDEQCFEVLKTALSLRKNILICGSTSSGKTSFLNSLLQELSVLCPDDRLVILEDQHEIQCKSKNHEFLFQVRNDQGEVTHSMDANVMKSLRMNPDRIIVGEVRDKETARSVFQAWVTGHGGGLCTFHSSNALTGYNRFLNLAGIDFTNPTEVALAGEGIDYVAFLSKGADGRKVREVVEVTLDHNGQPSFTSIYLNNNYNNTNTNTKIPLN